jgi:acetolactate synthase-1/2/3 large subunit
VGPRSLGRHTAALVGDADLVILIGTRTNQNGTDSWRQIPAGAQVIHIDVDPQEIGRNYQALRLVGDARETLRELVHALNAQDLSQRRDQWAAVTSRIAECWRQFDEDRQQLVRATASPIRPERIMAELQASLTPQTTVVADASYSSMWVVGQLRSLTSGMRFLTPRGLAGLGWGLPLALGAKAARPEHPVVAIVGDGGFAHSWAEMETMVRSELPVTIILLNNGILGFQRDAETVKFGRFTSACHFAPVDHMRIAQACGCPAVRVEDPAELTAHLQGGLAGKGPLFIEVMTDPEAHPALSLFAGLNEAA